MYYTGRAVEDAVSVRGRDGHVVGDLQERPSVSGLCETPASG
jgi:hypothetical protein